MRPLRHTFLCLIAAAGCAHRVPAPSDACEVPGAAALLQPGHTVLFGEMHGTEQTQQLIGAVVCQASQGAPVQLGLEIPADATPHLDGYLAGTETRETALGDPFWQDPYQDGRRSEAMFGLITRVAALQKQGAKVSLFRFDITAADGKVDRDETMAKHILEAAKVHPEAVTLVLVGNLHARKQIGAPWNPQQVWMAHHLDGKVPLTTLDVSYASGSGWVCHTPEASSCGAAFIGGKSGAPGITLAPSKDGNYDGHFFVGALTASGPAAFPALQEKMKAELPALAHSDSAQRFEAMQAYEKGDFAGCATKFGQVKTPTQEDVWGRGSCLAKAGDADGAFVQIKQAHLLGAKIAEMRADEDFQSLKDDPRWDKL